MAYATISAPTASTTTSASTSHTINRPGASNSGDLVLLWADSWADDLDAPGGAGWIKLSVEDFGTAAWSLYAIKDTGSLPSTWTFTTPGSRLMSAQAFRVSSWGGTLTDPFNASDDIDLAFISVSSSSSPDPASVTAGWGAADNLFVLFGAIHNDNTPTVSTISTGYTSLGARTEAGSTSGGSAVQGWYKQSTSSSDDPGAITMSATAWTIWITVAIKPGTSGSGSGSSTITPSGGIVFAGSAPYLRYESVTGTGGLSFASASSLLYKRIMDALGGIVFSGDGSFNYGTILVTPSGGVVFDGQAVIEYRRIISAEGGLVFSGSGQEQYFFAMQVSGGLVFDGNGSFQSVSSGLTITPSGGIVFGGGAIFDYFPPLSLFTHDVEKRELTDEVIDDVLDIFERYDD